MTPLKKVVLVAALLALVGCGVDTTAERHLWDGALVAQSNVQLSFSAFEADGLASHDLGLCVREFVLYSLERGTTPVRVAVPLDREILADATGTDLGTLRRIPPGEYHTVEVVLGSHCQSTKSARLLHGGNYHSSASDIVLRFRGAKQVSEETEEFVLSLRPLLVSLENLSEPTAETPDRLKWILENSEGSF